MTNGRSTTQLLGALTLLLGLIAIVAVGSAYAGRPGDATRRAWKIEPTPNPAGAAISVLSSVACPSRRVCIAVGSSAVTPSSPTLTLAQQSSGRRWRMQPIPAPRGTSDTLYGVSCPSAHACMAVGSAFHTANRRQTVLTEAWNGKRWRVQRTAPGKSPSSLSAVSCTSGRSCMAVGVSQGSTGPQAIVESWDGTRWRVEQIPGSAAGMRFLGVSCSSARACVAVGYNRAGGNARPLAESWNGKQWKLQAVPLPHGARAGMFDAVSCTSAKACTATGTDFDPGGPTLAETWNGRTWHPERTPNPANSSVSSSEVALNGVSCTSAKTCTAIGEYSPGHAAAYFIESWNGKRWRLEPTPHPADFAHGALLGISCTSARCTAVGAYTGSVRLQLTLAMAG